jgi:hypothetical protein
MWFNTFNIPPIIILCTVTQCCQQYSVSLYCYYKENNCHPFRQAGRYFYGINSSSVRALCVCVCGCGFHFNFFPTKALYHWTVARVSQFEKPWSRECLYSITFQPRCVCQIERSGFCQSSLEANPPLPPCTLHDKPIIYSLFNHRNNINWGTEVLKHIILVHSVPILLQTLYLHTDDALSTSEVRPTGIPSA